MELKPVSLFDYVDSDFKKANPTRWESGKSSPPIVNGPGYIKEFDEQRLTGQMQRVYKLMKDGRWRTLFEITEACKPGGEASISAQLRGLRKKKHGSHTVNRRRRGDPKRGLFEYQLKV